MPFLRRRGEIASDSNMRQHVKEDSLDIPPVPRLSYTSEQSAVSDTNDDARSQSPTAVVHEPTLDNVDDLLSRAPSRTSSGSLSRAAASPEETTKPRRFSVLRFRNASDSQLSLRAKQHCDTSPPPPVPHPPQIITTAPTGEMPVPSKKTSRKSLAVKLRLSSDLPRENMMRSPSKKSAKSQQPMDSSRSSLAKSRRPSSPSLSQKDSSRSQRPDMPNNGSESSRSGTGSPERFSRESPRPSSARQSKSSPFFKFRKQKKPPIPLFDLSHLPRKDGSSQAVASSTSVNAGSNARPPSRGSLSSHKTSKDSTTEGGPRPPLAPLLAASSAIRTGQSSPTRAATLLRGRSSTLGSLKRDSTDEHLMPPTTRTSSSTGRKSFSDLFGLTRLRQNSDLSRHGSFSPATPASLASKNNSLQLAREGIALPERMEDESPAKYLARVENVMSRSVIGAALAKASDPFAAATLRSFMRTFSFFGDPMDMSIRKLLMEAELPRETQHIDRFLQAFANRYHECNPGIFLSTDQAYFIAFSLLILHTDVFNKNNKHKMQKPDYLKNTSGEGVFEDVLECFYDNITYTPFIHVEDDFEFGGETSQPSKAKKTLSSSTSDVAKRATKEPIDPYTLILDGNLDALRPNLKSAIQFEDHYNYLGTAPGLNLKDLQKTFFRTGVLQIVSARSRPDAFMSDKTSTNPAEALPGIVDIKVTKVGLIWRKDPKRRKTRSPWQEWGAILTGAQLYFFRNVSWVKNLMHQYENHIKAGNDGIPIIFKPPLEDFKPDALMSTYGAVALQDTSYKRHKNAFVYARDGKADEVLLADNEEEMNDWLAKLNYAAAFSTAGVKMRSVAANYDGHARRGIRRLDSFEPAQTVQTPTGPVSIVRGQVDRQMMEDIQVARRRIMQQKIDLANEKLEAHQRKLDTQLRNARHLQVLAPIQPKTRENILSSAELITDQLKWTFIGTWRDKCHRDILVLDLDEEVPGSTDHATPTKKELLTEQQASPTAGRTPRARKGSFSQSTASQTDDYSLGVIPSASDIALDVETSLNKVFHTPPRTSSRDGDHDEQCFPFTLSDKDSRKQSVASTTASPKPSIGAFATTRVDSQHSQERPESRRSNDRAQDDIDAEERRLLQQAGLLESRLSRDQIAHSVSADSVELEIPNERERIERNKIRRSLHKTLREGAGHLSHHRSKRGKDVGSSAQEEENSEVTLTRGTGSFMVHGKKASVIQVGSDLQNMSQEEKNKTRKQEQIPEIAPPVEQEQEAVERDDVSTRNVRAAGEDNIKERRGSAASASTATARSFQELHRRYSSAQAARSASGPGRLGIPSDGESEAAVSFSDGRHSPLPPIETESQESGTDESS